MQDKALQPMRLHHDARTFGFKLSYPKGNPHGYEYEPWHWFFTAAQQGAPPLPRSGAA